jgi:hypothetical protein
MSDENEKHPETGAGGGGSIPETGPGAEYAVKQDMPTTPQVGKAPDGGDFVSPNLPENEGSEGSTRDVRSMHGPCLRSVVFDR